MTQKKIDDLLELITLWLEDIHDIQENSHQFNQHMMQLETRVDNMGRTIHGLEQNVQSIDERFQTMLHGVRKEREILQK